MIFKCYKKYSTIHKEIQKVSRYYLLRSGIIGKEYPKRHILIIGQNPKLGEYKKNSYACKKFKRYDTYVNNWLESANYTKVLFMPIEYFNEIFEINISLKLDKKDKRYKKEFIKKSLYFYGYTNIIKYPSHGEIKSKWIDESKRIFKKELSLLKPKIIMVLGCESKKIYCNSFLKGGFKKFKNKYFVDNVIFFNHPSHGHWGRKSNKLLLKKNHILKILNI